MGGGFRTLCKAVAPCVDLSDLKKRASTLTYLWTNNEGRGKVGGEAGSEDLPKEPLETSLTVLR